MEIIKTEGKGLAVIQLAPNRPRRVEAGHPWVYRTEVAEVNGHYRPGDIVDVVDHRGRFLGRGYYNPLSQIVVRLLTGRQEEINGDFFRRRLEAALAYRRLVAGEAGACRLVFAESDLLPALIVDRYGDYLVLQTLALGIDRWKETIADLLMELVRPEGIIERNDVPVRELEGLEQRKGILRGKIPSLVEIEENGVRLLVDPAGGQKTGHFLDQRENRAALHGYIEGARVLDCFCHTGGFSLHAASYGARETLGIDISEEAVEAARRNATLNGLEEVCRFEAVNAFDELRRLEKEGARFDAVILDPPAFVKNRRALEGAIRGYKEINLRALKLLQPGGFLFTASCSYHLEEELFREILVEAAADAKRQVRLVERRTQARDHPILLPYRESSYLKFFILQAY